MNGNGTGTGTGFSRRAASTGAPIAVLIVLGVLAAVFALLAGVSNPTGLIVAVPCTAAASWPAARSSAAASCSSWRHP